MPTESVLQTGVRRGMAQALDMPLPEIDSNNFERAWTRFQLVAAAQEWYEKKAVEHCANPS